MNWLTASARIISKSVPGERTLEAMQLDKPPITRRKTKPLTTRLRKEQMTAVVWTTPLGLPVVQPYRKVKRRQVMTNTQSVYISDPYAPSEGERRFFTCYCVDETSTYLYSVNSQKQSSAFPPNFIHSLDATHMLLTALECRVCFFFPLSERRGACLPSFIDARPYVRLGP